MLGCLKLGVHSCILIYIIVEINCINKIWIKKIKNSFIRHVKCKIVWSIGCIYFTISNIIEVFYSHVNYSYEGFFFLGGGGWKLLRVMKSIDFCYRIIRKTKLNFPFRPLTLWRHHICIFCSCLSAQQSCFSSSDQNIYLYFNNNDRPGNFFITFVL